MSYVLQRLEWPPKETGEVLDYSLNWKEAPPTPAGDEHEYVAVLDTGETIVAVSHAIVTSPSDDADNPLKVDSEVTFDDDQQTTVWLSGGVAGVYEIECTITTNTVTGDSRTYVRGVKLKVVD